MKDPMKKWVDPKARTDTFGQDDKHTPDSSKALSSDAGLGLSGATTEWLLSNRRRFLAAVLRTWLQTEVTSASAPLPNQLADTSGLPELHMTNPNAVHFGTGGLAAIIEDVWSAERHLQPDFDTAVLYAADKSTSQQPQDVLGVMTASARPALGGVYIQGLAIHPAILHHPANFLKASGLLVEAGIDVSVNLGLRGWVMCHADDVHAVIWRALGFSRQSGPLFQRMGYFDRQPINQRRG